MRRRKPTPHARYTFVLLGVALVVCIAAVHFLKRISYEVRDAIAPPVSALGIEEGLAENVTYKESTSVYTINIQMPVIEGATYESNKALAEEYTKIIDRFKQDALQSFKDVKMRDPKYPAKSNLTISFSTEIKTDRYINIAVHKEIYFAGSAHPSHSIDTYTYDYMSNSFIDLQSLFNTDPGYIEALSSLARKDLGIQAKNPKNGLGNKDMILDGTKAEVSNFTRFSPLEKGLVIYFPEYQVAPYVAGSQKVTIPYKDLAKYINQNSVIGAYTE